jgi:hypothetical protein
MTNLPIPSVPDIARARGATRDELISWFLTYYDTEGAPWNYRTGTRVLKTGYRGLHDLDQLIAGCAREATKSGRKANEDIVRMAAPIAFGRSTQVFDLPRRQFSFGRDLHAGYRIPFFFVENRIIKLYFVQPRKGCNLTYDELCMVATIHKRYLLDIEFFGEKTDIEYIDLSADPDTKAREIHRYSLESLELWPDDRLTDRLTVIAEALDYVRSSGAVRPRTRRPPHSADMPLFD